MHTSALFGLKGGLHPKDLTQCQVRIPNLEKGPEIVGHLMLFQRFEMHIVDSQGITSSPGHLGEVKLRFRG